MMTKNLPEGVSIIGFMKDGYEKILTKDALSFVAKLSRTFDRRRKELLAARDVRQQELNAGAKLDFLAETQAIRDDESWKVNPIPADLQDRRVEITGPVERKMLINALNSGASVFMADFEDANSPTWENNIEGHINLIDAIEGTITFTNPNGKKYELNEKVAVLMVRPRGWHLDEKHVLIDGIPVSGSLFDFGLYFFHNAKRLLKKGAGPYFYLPKLESHKEAKLWNDVFNLAQDELGIPRGTIKGTVLIENIMTAFEMEEILYELREHIAGLNAGRWDYMFSIIRKFQNDKQFVFPDRGQITMTVPFMRAYTELLVKTCHKRGAHAMGGMAAFIPSRKDEEVNRVALQKVREDKDRESKDGFDGTWVAHPDLVPIAREAFDKVLGDKPNQKDRLRSEVSVTAADLTNFTIADGRITEEGLRHNINVGIQYLGAWLSGTGAVGIYNLMEDAATCEISRAQVWQLVHHETGILDDGRKVTIELVRQLIPEELKKIENIVGAEYFKVGNYDVAAKIFDDIIKNAKFTDFLTIVAYNHLN